MSKSFYFRHIVAYAYVVFFRYIVTVSNTTRQTAYVFNIYLVFVIVESGNYFSKLIFVVSRVLPSVNLLLMRVSPSLDPK